MNVKEVNSGQQYRYYRLRKVILAGVPVEALYDLLKIVEVSSGSRESLIERNKVVRRSLARNGLGYESCYCASLSKEGGLFKLKGLMRVERCVGNEKIRMMLEREWNKRIETKVEVLAYNVADLKKYIRESMLRIVVEGDYVGAHLIKSVGWVLQSGQVSGSDWFRVDKVTRKSEVAVVKKPLTEEELDKLRYPLRFE